MQTPYGDSGRTTFFIKSEKDWDKNAKHMIDEKLKVMKRINHMPGTLEACVTRHGTLVGPVQTDITGFEEVTPYKGGWCGNDVTPDIFNAKTRKKLREMASALGDRLYQEDYKGIFCMDFLIDTESELKNKVTWPSKEEEVNASVVVVVTVIVMMAFIVTVDFLFSIGRDLVYPGI